MDVVLKIIEYIGVISFAISGTVIAIKKKTDAVGAVFFALLTCFGGGIIRDVALGVVPRVLTEDSNYILAGVCIFVSLAFFALAFVPRASRITQRSHSFAVDFTDAIGLSVFCVTGINTAIELGFENSVLLIFCGCVTGVGGGMLRDVCSAEIPFILRKHIYLIPTLCGSVFYALTYKHMMRPLSLFIAIFIIMALRVLAIIFKWNLPVPKGEGEGIKETRVVEEKKEENEKNEEDELVLTK